MGEVSWLGGANLPEAPKEKVSGRKCSPSDLPPYTEPLHSRAGERCKVRYSCVGTLSSQLFWFPFEKPERVAAWACSLMWQTFYVLGGAAPLFCQLVW